MDTVIVDRAAADMEAVVTATVENVMIVDKMAAVTAAMNKAAVVMVDKAAMEKEVQMGRCTDND